MQVEEAFRQIGCRATSMAGLVKLYRLWEKHPNLPVEQLIDKTPSPFPEYIQDSLDEVLICLRCHPLALCSASLFSISHIQFSRGYSVLRQMVNEPGQKSRSLAG